MNINDSVTLNIIMGGVSIGKSLGIVKAINGDKSAIRVYLRSDTVPETLKKISYHSDITLGLNEVWYNGNEYTATVIV